MNIAIIGAGNMGGAIARGIAAKSPSTGIIVSNPTRPKLDALLDSVEATAEKPAIEVTTDNAEAAARADIIVLAVKPWILADVILGLIDVPGLASKTFVSLAGGVSLDRLDEMLAPCFDKDALPPVFHVIPDTAAAIGRSMTFVSARRAQQPLIDAVVDIFGCVGRVAVIEERLMDAATALCSCGIAYVYKFIQACVQAGVQLGFRPADALSFVNATVDGAVGMLEANGTSPQQEIDKVTTPGGMTIKGINELDHAGFTSAVIRGILTPVAK